jgi:ABC-2 type transport system permease protein
MSAPSDTMTDSPFDRAAPPRAAAHPVRPFFWSVRRELWENQAIWIAPLAVAALVIFGSLVAAVGSHNTKTVHRTTATAPQAGQPGAPESGAAPPPVPPPSTTTTMSQSSPGGSVTVSKVIKIEGPPPTPEQRRAMAAFPFYMVTGAMTLTMFLVAAFYCLGGMYNERRDRSILFWKSLPVRDLTTVMSKIVVPMAILPAVTFVMALAAELLLLTIGVLAFAAHAQSADAEPSVPLGNVIAVLAYGLVALTLWWAPLYAWLLLVSGWAKRAPFLWAVLPPLGLAIAEKLAFGTTVVARLIQSRVFGGFEAAFVTPKHPNPAMNPMAYTPQIDAAKFVSAPGLWLGLLVAAGLIAATVWMRRRREPI